MRYDAANLIIHPRPAGDAQITVDVTPEQAGWDLIHSQVRRIGCDQTWHFATEQYELALIMLGGRVDVTSSRGSWQRVGVRADVFAGCRTRSINLVVVEVYTPGGSWSSYPPHKHDRHAMDADGSLLEADLEEIYYYKFDGPEGYAYQRVYTRSDSPLHQARQPIDSVLPARNNDIVLEPEGYHPVGVAPGATGYYLNVLAGSAVAGKSG